MIAWASQWHCEEVKPYYYDYLNRREEIPAAVTSHIESCSDCQEKIAELSRMLEGAMKSEEPSDSTSQSWLRMIQLHFQLADQEVRCHHVRSFLPVLLHPDYPIRIATPVMDHLRECQVCQQDYHAIKALNLRPDQLSRLSDFFADVQSEIVPGPHLTPSQLEDYTQGGAGELDEIAIKHLFTCEPCSRRLCELLEHPVLDSHQNCPDCERASMADLFELVFPYGRDAGELTIAEGPQDRVHVLTCAAGRRRVLELYRCVFLMAHRPDGSVVTRFDLEQAGLLDENLVDRVTESGDGVVAKTSAESRASLFIRFRPIAVAAVALLVCALIFVYSNGTAEADLSASVRQILAQTSHLKIVERLPGQEEPLLTMWVVKPSQLVALKSSRSSEVYDLEQGKAYDVSADGVVTETAMAPEKTRFYRENWFAKAWGMLTALQAIPPESQWQPCLDDTSHAAPTITYELLLEGTFGGQARWVIEMERDSQRPVRIEKYYRHHADEAFKADRISEIYYGTPEELAAEIRGLINP